MALAPDAQRSRTLLKAATELFLYEPRHTRTEVAIYEELAVHLMRATPREDRIAIASLLAGHPDAPLAVLQMLIADEPAVAAPILAGAPKLPDVALLALVAQGSPEHLSLLAARPGLSAAVVEALVRKLPPERLAPLVANPAVALPEAVTPLLLAAARGRGDLASALARRTEDIDDADLTDLFIDLDGRGRRRVLQSLEILALREFAARRPLPRAPRPDQDVAAELAHASLSRDLNRIARLIATLSGIDEAIARRLLADPGGEPLAVALKASGLDLAVATRVILFSGDTEIRDYFEVKRLVELFEMLSMRSALLLAGRWRTDAEPIPARLRRHRPQMEDGAPGRGRESHATPPAKADIAAPARWDRG
ncbi:MAG TPA: DUF2336 domain-containing protein [Methylomirabilota bacterium]|nr:DUF2336 domain-containing protein [Methylomirabilota bacterium]